MITVYKTILTSKQQLVNNIYLFTFKLIDPREIDFIPGQYLILKINNHPRLYSICSSNKVRNQIKFIIELIPGGLASTFLLNLKINNEVEFSGPVGQFILKKNDNKKIFLTTGTGIAPVLSILESRWLPASNYFLFWGLRYYKDIYLFDQVKKFNPKICLSREENLDTIPENEKQFFDVGRIDVCLEKLLSTDNEWLNADYYLCGRKEIIESLRIFLLSKNIKQNHIFFEKF